MVMPTHKENLKNYISNYPGNMVGFLTDVADILYSLGHEWSVFGKKSWGDIFILSGDSISYVAKDLKTIEKEHKQENPVKFEISTFKDCNSLLASFSDRELVDFMIENGDKVEEIILKELEAATKKNPSLKKEAVYIEKEIKRIKKMVKNYEEKYERKK